MTKPNQYVLGGNQEIFFVPKDQDGAFFVPAASDIRLTIKEPTGTLWTVSGGDIYLASGYLGYIYHPQTIGWYQYEIWVKDPNGREKVETNGYDVYDKVY